MRVRSWYGLKAEIDVENELWHRVKVDGVSLNHPPLVNLFIRYGLPRRDRLRLSSLHEFGHFQTMPLSIVHTLILYWALPKSGSLSHKIIWWLAFALTHQVFWEIASEGYVVAHEGETYIGTYRQKSNLLIPLFWSIMSGVELWLHLWLICKNNLAFQHSMSARYE